VNNRPANRNNNNSSSSGSSSSRQGPGRACKLRARVLWMLRDWGFEGMAWFSGLWLFFGTVGLTQNPGPRRLRLRVHVVKARVRARRLGSDLVPTRP
jgi:hypothetical protein